MKKAVGFFISIGILFFLLAGCSNKEATPGKKCTAMYVTFGKDNYVMVNQENRTPFTVSMPEKIYNISGEQITAENLQNGNLLEITSDGMVMETYPEQYPGVTEIRVIDEGNPQNTKQYQDIIDMIYVEPDASEPPSLQIEHITEMAASVTMAARGSYQWNWIEDEASGIGGTAVACGTHILGWKNMNSVTLEEPSKLRLIFTQEPDSVQAERWPESQLGMESPNEEPESVEIALEDGKWFMNAEPGYVYSIYAKWGDSFVEFGFMA